MAVYFGTSGITGSSSSIYNWVKNKLGSPTVNVELTLDHVESNLEDANNEFSLIVNTSQIKNNLSNILGADKNVDLTGKLQQQSLNFLSRMAKMYEEETSHGGKGELDIGYVEFSAHQKYVELNGLTSLSGSATSNLKYSNGDSITSLQGSTIVVPPIILFEVYHYPQKNNTAYYYDQFGFIKQEFGDFAVPVGGGSISYNYIYPLWSDILNADYLKTHTDFRKSHYRYMYAGRRLYVYPIPKSPVKIWLRFRIRPSLLDDLDPSTTGVTSIADAPYRNFNYEVLNQLSQTWIRKYTLALCKETLGRIRGKYDNVPIPNGTVTLDHASLRDEAEKEKKELVEWLEKQLDEMSYNKMLENDANEAKSINDQLKFIPVKIFKK